MKNFNTKPLISLFVFITIIFLYLVAEIRDVNLRCFSEYLVLIPQVASLVGMVYFAFTIWLWKWWIFQKWLVPFPNLNGTWEGHIQSDSKDESGQPVMPSRAVLSIRQKFGRLSCIMRSEEMTSHSYLEGFIINKDDQVRRLCYSYTSKPISAIRDRSTPHDGSALLNIIGQPVEKLEGEYWTQRNTTGSITLIFRKRKILEEFPDDLLDGNNEMQ